MKKSLKQVWVHPSFKKKLDYEAKVMRGITVAEFTKSLGEDSDDLKEQLRKKNGKKKTFWEGF